MTGENQILRLLLRVLSQLCAYAGHLSSMKNLHHVAPYGPLQKCPSRALVSGPWLPSPVLSAGKAHVRTPAAVALLAPLPWPDGTGLAKELCPVSEDVPAPPHPSWPCTFLFFLYCINDPSRRLTLPPVMTAFSSFWCDFRTLGVSKDWGAFIVIRNRHNAPFCAGPLTIADFFFLSLPLPPEINPVWAIDAVWPFGCNLHFFLLIIFFYNHPNYPWGRRWRTWNFYPNPGSPALGNQMGLQRSI